MARPTIRRGSSGTAVRTVQAALGVEIDGVFGPPTEAAVTRFQRDHNLTPDGVVGPLTWAELDKQYALPPEEPLPEPFEEARRKAITTLVSGMPIATYSWKDRGIAPPGYTQGMALVFADAVRRFHAGESVAHEIAKANTHDPDNDALSWYAGIFNNAGMNNDKPGIDTLRHVFVLLLGLGMRESGGRYCESRDMSATNVTAVTAEAGLFQASWNFESSSPFIRELLDEYVAAGGLADSPPQCALDVFREGVTCKAVELQTYGTGKGRDYQLLSKNCPAFAVMSTAVGVRNMRKHWGPLNRLDAEIRPEADAMFQYVQSVVTPIA
jgi:peptidoglycan hydrolase-like protein with peptidoglycan-binding domain